MQEVPLGPHGELEQLAGPVQQTEVPAVDLDEFLRTAREVVCEATEAVAKAAPKAMVQHRSRMASAAGRLTGRARIRRLSTEAAMPAGAVALQELRGVAILGFREAGRAAAASRLEWH